MKEGRWLDFIFTKLVLTFLIAIIPLYVVTLTMNRMAFEQNKQEITKSLAIKLQNYLEAFEYEIQRLVELERDYLIDADLLMLSSVTDGMTDYERNTAVQNLQKRLQIMKTSSVYIKDTSIYIPLMNRTINTYQFQTEVNQEELTLFKDTSSNGSLVFLGNRLYLSQPYQGLPAHQADIAFVLVIEISTEQIEKALQTAFGSDGGGAMLTRTSSQQLISSQLEVNDLRPLQASIQKFNQYEDHFRTSSAGTTEKKWLTSVAYSPYLDLTFAAFVPQEKILAPLQRYESWFWLFSLLSVGVVVIFSSWIYRQVHRPLVKLVFAFRKMENGNFTPVVQHRSRDEFGYLYRAFNSMVNRLAILIREVYEQKIKIQQSELKRLQAQINPHFLFNNHFILARLIKYQDYESAERFATYMGEYLQFITRDAKDEISLIQETKHARSYVDIQSFCFANRVEVHFEQLPSHLHEIPVPRFILQPVIENAYKYVFENRLSPGVLHITFNSRCGQIFVYIEDNGDGLDESMLTILNKRLTTPIGDAELESTGLINIHQRLQIKFGSAAGLTFSRSDLGGLKVEVRLMGIESTNLTELGGI
ncbi:histidine kinase [Paenibacillus sp. IITD108]